MEPLQLTSADGTTKDPTSAPEIDDPKVKATKSEKLKPASKLPQSSLEKPLEQRYYYGHLKDLAVTLKGDIDEVEKWVTSDVTMAIVRQWKLDAFDVAPAAAYQLKESQYCFIEFLSSLWETRFVYRTSNKPSSPESDAGKLLVMTALACHRLHRKYPRKLLCESSIPRTYGPVFFIALKEFIGSKNRRWIRNMINAVEKKHKKRTLASEISECCDPLEYEIAHIHASPMVSIADKQSQTHDTPQSVLSAPSTVLMAKTDPNPPVDNMNDEMQRPSKRQKLSTTSASLVETSNGNHEPDEDWSANAWTEMYMSIESLISDQAHARAKERFRNSQLTMPAGPAAFVRRDSACAVTVMRRSVKAGDSRKSKSELMRELTESIIENEQMEAERRDARAELENVKAAWSCAEVMLSAAEAQKVKRDLDLGYLEEKVDVLGILNNTLRENLSVKEEAWKGAEERVKVERAGRKSAEDALRGLREVVFAMGGELQMLVKPGIAVEVTSGERDLGVISPPVT